MFHNINPCDDVRFRIVGVAKAKELIFTSAKLTSKQSYEIGLVNESVPAGTAYEKALEMALIIASKGPIAQRQAKKAIEQGVEVYYKPKIILHY